LRNVQTFAHTTHIDNVMERPPSHITDDLGENQLRAVFGPLGWVVNKLHKDYGVDFDIQIARPK